ncbi:hypothetical protein SDC9_201402 [bioreactor metagenome]|uniref:Uncharacterized protein n=1 Tax=bioreactor metagenome TaxID=1076179 RepID=A0A645IRK5_9ZZZZ
MGTFFKAVKELFQVVDDLHIHLALGSLSSLDRFRNCVFLKILHFHLTGRDIDIQGFKIILIFLI